MLSAPLLDGVWIVYTPLLGGVGTVVAPPRGLFLPLIDGAFIEPSNYKRKKPFSIINKKNNIKNYLA